MPGERKISGGITGKAASDNPARVADQQAATLKINESTEESVSDHTTALVSIKCWWYLSPAGA